MGTVALSVYNLNVFHNLKLLCFFSVSSMMNFIPKKSLECRGIFADRGNEAQRG